MIQSGTCIEYGVAAITGKVFPKIFKTEEEANDFISERSNPNNWEVVCRKVIYGEWKSNWGVIDIE